MSILPSLDSVINEAKKAFTSWALKPLEERVAYLFAFQEALQDGKERFALKISSEVGKPLWESLQEVSSMIAKVDISLKAYLERTGEKRETNPPYLLRHRPHGVIAVLGPFNFPGHLPLGHIIPALLAGNTIVFKPSHHTPKVGQALVDLFQLPHGVLQLIEANGSDLAYHPLLDGLFFTGSYPVGKQLSEHFGKTPEKILVLEMGGNNPLIVWHPKDEKAAIYTTLISAFLTSGQRCTATRRLIIPKNNNGFLEKLIKAIKLVKVGYFQDKPEPFMGPLISLEAAQAVLQAEEKLLELGAKSLHPLKRGPGALLHPGVIDVTSIPLCPDEEIFGPLLQVIQVNTFEEALEAANTTSYGLVASLLTDDADLYKQFYVSMRAGLIHWNAPTTGATSHAPFGGIGHSGNLRPSGYYAADYCAYPVVSIEHEKLILPHQLLPGIHL